MKSSRRHRGPLRLIVRTEVRQLAFGGLGLTVPVRVEVLECGHELRPRQDVFGETNAIRRRCRRCLETTRPPGG